MEYQLLLSVILGIAVLLIFILYFKIHAFIALFLASITVGIVSGMSPEIILVNLQKGMGDTLGFVAAVVGLGAMFGAILEESGGAYSLANFIVNKIGEKKAPWAMVLTGFIVAMPVFFDVAFIILFPMIYALHKRTGKPLLLYGIPLLAGLAISHSFIPPTPGPIAVASIMEADLGWVIITGIAAGLPAAILAGPVFGKFISGKIKISPGGNQQENEILLPENLPSALQILAIICLPIILIIFNSIISSPFALSLQVSENFKKWLSFSGHPFSALLIANLIAWYVLGIQRGYSKEKLLKITGNSLAPAGIIILITGAGGMFKQILTETGAGKMLADNMMSLGTTPLIFSFIVAALMRILQGSATVAMLTAAGMTASLTSEMTLSEIEKALIVTAIASGATILSHVNDSGFWLVSRYFALTEKQTFLSWSVATTIIALTALLALVIIEKAFVN